ncbi:MAG TPA: ECF-type sigma factor [Phycisphaerales bacterium]|nr:ECF-type sigma factor [Phycisphaerales bacterium]
MEGTTAPLPPSDGRDPAEAARARSEEMFDRLYADLRRYAHSQMKFERASGILQPTALVHEAYLKVLSTPETEWESRGHFFAAVAQTMRRILIDDARRRHALKHGGGRKRVPLDTGFSSRPESAGELLALNEALDKLERTDARTFRVVMLRFFVGLRIEQIAEAMDCSPRTVKRDWEAAKEWLKAELAGTPDPEPRPRD